MKQLEIDLDFLDNLATIITRLRWCTSTSMVNPSKVAVVGGAIRDMLFKKPVSDIDVFYEGTIDDYKLKLYFADAVASGTSYPDGFNVTHSIMHELFPVPIQLIQVKDIKKHIETFPSPEIRLSFDHDGIHGLDAGVINDANCKTFFWDMKVDGAYFLKIKAKYSDWKHEFLEQDFNPEFVLEFPEVEVQ